ncbi:hypothetical protein C4K02_3679 [Pseudomonas synxantha]|nr:hypothetical protein C4K02_3679 [Pseudomonas synxantha]
MGVRHWPRKVAHYAEVAGFEHAGRRLSVTRNPDIRMDRTGLASGSLLKRLKPCRRLAIYSRCWHFDHRLKLIFLS